MYGCAPYNFPLANSWLWDDTSPLHYYFYMLLECGVIWWIVHVYINTHTWRSSILPLLFMNTLSMPPLLSLPAPISHSQMVGGIYELIHTLQNSFQIDHFGIIIFLSELVSFYFHFFDYIYSIILYIF